MDMYTMPYYKRITNKDLLYRAFSSMFRGSPDGPGVRGRMDTGIWTAESLGCSPEAVTNLFIGYPPQYKLKRYLKITLFHLTYITHLNTSLIVG